MKGAALAVMLTSLFSAPRDAPHHLALRGELRRAGFIEGGNLIIDERGFGLSGAEFTVHATELVSAYVDVIMAGGRRSPACNLRDSNPRVDRRHGWERICAIAGQAWR